MVSHIRRQSTGGLGANLDVVHDRTVASRLALCGLRCSPCCSRIVSTADMTGEKPIEQPCRLVLSETGLIEQLEFDGFTPDEAQHAVDQVY